MSSHASSSDLLIVNEFAIHMEKFGIPPLASRIFGVMLLVEPAEKSTQQIIAISGGSKGAVSLMMRIMEHMGIIEKCSIPGQRGHGWRIRRHFMVHMIEHKLIAVRNIQEFLENRLKSTENLSEFAISNLQEMMLFYQFLNEQMSDIFEQWKQKCPHLQNLKHEKRIEK